MTRVVLLALCALIATAVFATVQITLIVVDLAILSPLDGRLDFPILAFFVLAICSAFICAMSCLRASPGGKP